MMFERMKQEGGDNSTNIQIAGNATIGVSYEAARQIALDVFKANFYEFSEVATKKALERAEEITEEFVNKFYEEIPHLTLKLEEPSVQSSMYNAQKEYAKTGDKDLEERLLDVLIERIASDERSLRQIVLDEALLILPKLTNDQVDILTLILSAAYSHHGDVLSIPAFIYFIDNKISKFYPANINNRSFYTHLQFTGCCISHPRGKTYKPLEEIFRENYKGLFSKGFSEADFKIEVDDDISKYDSLLMMCLRNPTSLQFDVLTDYALDEKIKLLNLSDITKLKAFWEKSIMTPEEVKKYIITINSNMERLFADWMNTGLNTITLTSVGYAIALINLNKQMENKLRLDEFI